MMDEPRNRDGYGSRQVEAARRVLVDLGQVLAGFRDCLVLVGGWVPDLLIVDSHDAHVGSLDVDLALDARKLDDGRYADLLASLFVTRRYARGSKPFQLATRVGLQDGGVPLEVQVEFLAPKEAKLERNNPKLIPGFRVLLADGCASAFNAPLDIELAGRATRGEVNSVVLRVASLPDFLIMKAYALAGREKPKDAYDIYYCLDNFPGGLESLASTWRVRREDNDVSAAIGILQRKFSAVDAVGPWQVAEFLGSNQLEEKAMQARRAYELVQQLLRLV